MIDPAVVFAVFCLYVAECLFKLAAFLAAGVFVTYFIFNGFTDIFQRIAGTEHQDHIASSWGIGPPPYLTWTSYLLLSMSAILLLPRQFPFSVVENSDEKHILTAMWLFPLYMILINIFLLPISLGGLAKGLPNRRRGYVRPHAPASPRKAMALPAGIHWRSLGRCRDDHGQLRNSRHHDNQLPRIRREVESRRWLFCINP